jgi:hypothetical protein
MLTAIAFLLFSICAVFISPNTNATSAYDNVITLGEPKVICPNNQVHDLTTSYVSYVLSKDSSFDSSLYAALDRGSGWGLAQNVRLDGTAWLHFYVSASTTPSTASFATSSSNPNGMLRSTSTRLMILSCNEAGEIVVSNASLSGTRALASAVNIDGNELKPVYLNWPINYPSGYEGIEVSDVMEDVDDDGLNETQEQVQGTLDSSKDTDGDGLDDYVESRWYPDRTSIFCGILQCAYPSPLTKDVYIEIDWMKDSSNMVYKPSATQLDLVEDMYTSKGINFHADTGQFGGGNELATYTQSLPYTGTSGQIDFWDYKNGGDGIIANFSSDRNSIWRYMIYGYNYAESSGSSGWAETMGDDLFISGGLIDDMTGLASLDRALAGTMAHEIGHNLCLSDEQVFVEQPIECAFSGIDNDGYKPQNYESVMNYRYQLTDDDDLGVVDYSDGSNATDDHDDWGAVALGMGGFSGTRTAQGARDLPDNYDVLPDGSVIIKEAPIQEIVESNEKQSQQELHIQGQSNDDLLPAGFSRSIEESSEEKKLTKESDETLSSDWTVLLGGGITMAIVVLGATWYYVIRK